PGADPDEIGKTLPIIYGEHSDHLCLAIDAGAIDSLWKDLGISGDYIFVSDPSIFPNSGTIQIDDEQITYSSNLKNERKLRIAQRGVNNTTRLSHDKGAVVAEVQTNYDYLIANHPIQKVLNVKVDDVLQSGSDFTVLTNENGKAKIRFTTRPSLKKSVDIEVNDTISMTASQSGHAHAIGAPSVVTQYTTEPNMLITEGGMTTKVGFDGSVVNNRIKFEALPLGAIGGSTYVSLTGNSSINWEIGYWYASGGLFSTRDWHVIVAGKGTWAGRFSGVSNDMWIRKVTSTAYSLYMGRANRDVTYTSSMTETKPPIATIRTGGVSLTGNSVSETVIGKVITCDVIGWPDDGSGSLTGLANGAIAQPRHIIQHLLKTYGLATNAEVQTIDFPSADSSSWVFQMSVRIDEPLTIRDVIKNIEQQSRTIITYTGGRWRMTNRPSSTPNPTPDITILDSNVKRMENGASSMRESRSGLRTLVNKHVYRAGLKSDGAWTLSNVESALTSQSRYGVRQQNIDFAYLFDYDNKITPLIEWLSARESNPNRKILIMDVTAAIYALEVGDVVNYNSTKHSIDLYFECIEIGAKGLTDSTITLEQI
ncbi:hypothetical protein KAR91_65175, partial [Candidatus Pacearchaeota archaeon]|nr:hypothetical protein [Candidatus Pacearchaeota archaeon]